MENAATPMLRQYREIKARHQDCILFFRLGDFYEMFFEDAKDASSLLDLVLTSRGQDAMGKIPMCGVPYHAADNYIAKLIKAGRKVAICEQMEGPSLASAGGGSASGGKGIVKRDVIRVITAGNYLDDSTPARCLLCLVPLKDGSLGFAFCDASGGTIHSNIWRNAHQAIEAIAKLPLCECVFPESDEKVIKDLLAHPLLKPRQILLSPCQDWYFNLDMARQKIHAHFGVLNVSGFGLAELPAAVSACGALLEYLGTINKTELKHLGKISLYTDDDFLFLSPASHQGLELEDVLKTVDCTQTPMGRRQFRFWLYHPLKNAAAIQERQQAVMGLKNNVAASGKIHQLLSHMPDLEKALARISGRCSSVKDLLALRVSLSRAPFLVEAAAGLDHRLLSVEDLVNLREKLTSVVNPDVPLGKPEGKIVLPGINAELDELRGIQENGRAWLAEFQAREIKRAGISSLKVGFNNVFGYYIEITKTHQKSVPVDYIRKQTLVNAERYITPELKEYEEKFLTAQDKILAIERNILQDLERAILEQSSGLYRYAEQIATLDCLMSLYTLGGWPGYVLPEINETDSIHIEDGRHPVVEKTVDHFTPNDTLLDCQTNRLIILTGPNMAGKSTFIRQTAVLVILAQMGSLVPARRASIGVVDKLFTRIGAQDAIAKGQSTFMVEMTEAADILNNLTPRSLLILDEIGRGTSTSDGLALAQALAEHIDAQGVRTLFATHFHELTALAETSQGIKNYNVAVKEWKDDIVFLHKIVPGGSDDSYGIHVAKLAGIPGSVIERSREILSTLQDTPCRNTMPSNSCPTT